MNPAHRGADASTRPGATRSILLPPTASHYFGDRAPGLWLLAALAWGWLLVEIVVPSAHRLSNGFSAYATAAQLAAAGQLTPRLYDDTWFWAQTIGHGFRAAPDIFNLNPPAAALLLLPIATLDPAAAKAGWTVANLVFLGVGLVLLGRTGRISANRAAFGLVAAAAFQPVQEELRSGQAYALLFVLEAASAFAFVRGHQKTAGGLIGVVLAVKSAGLLLPAVFLGSQRWRGLFGVSAGAGAVVVGSLLWISPSLWAAYLGLLVQPGRHPELAVAAYQSVPGFWLHLFRADPTWNPSPIANLPALASGLIIASETALVAVTLGLTGHVRFPAIVAPVARGAPRPSPLAGENQTLDSEATEARARVRLPAAFAAWATLSVVLAPASADYHYVLLLVPLALLLGAARTLPRIDPRQPPDWSLLGPVGLILITVCFVLVGAPLPYLSHRLTGGYWALLAYPKLYGGLILWLLAALILWHTRGAHPEATRGHEGAKA